MEENLQEIYFNKSISCKAKHTYNEGLWGMVHCLLVLVVAACMGYTGGQASSPLPWLPRQEVSSISSSGDDPLVVISLSTPVVSHVVICCPKLCHASEGT